MTDQLCSGMDYQSPHQTILDHSSACIICTTCGRVLEEGLSYSELHLKKVPEQKMTPDVQPSVNIDGDSPSEYLNKVGDGLHLCQSTINNAFDNYLKTKAKMQKLMNFRHQKKNKRLLQDDKNLLVYSLYNTLKEESCPRPIKELCWYAGSVPHANIYMIEKFFHTHSKHEDIPTPRLKPISAKDIIYSHYPYIDNFTFEDVKQVQHHLNEILPSCNFSALVTAAGIVFLYVNYIKKSNPQSLNQIANLFRITTMSIRRFVSKYKFVLCPIN